MNIFVLDKDINKSAQYHVDKHLVKMITEQNQLLSTAHRVLDGRKSIDYTTGRKRTFYGLPESSSHIYKATHINHPCSVWARQSLENYIWLCRSTLALCKEYTFRYEKIHKGESLANWLLLNPPKNIESVGFSKQPSAMPEYCIISEDVIENYRFYYNNEKRNLFSWKKREIPDWIN